MSRIERFPVSVHLLLVRNGKILLSLRQNTGFEDGKYSLPAGKLEQRESVAVGMIREAAEELGIGIRTDDLITLHVMNRLGCDSNRIDYFFGCTQWEGEPFNREPHKCGGLLWCDREHLPDQVIPYIRCALDNIAKKRPFSLFGWPESL